MKASLKNKTRALSRVPQDRESAVLAVGRIGEIRRAIASHKALADDAIRLVGEKYERDTKALADELTEHERGVQTWCEANRAMLTHDSKVKFHDFGTGRINWRQRPPKVTIRAAEAVIEACTKLGLLSFMRTKTELNKDAMLADPDKARLVPGVTISSEGEDFVIEPFELTTNHAINA